ncbi:MAG: hypothetical protein HY717_23560 [Planctomycetes bacterium]|nr:hypothetical protein [Planctomycetota bacterium]
MNPILRLFHWPRRPAFSEAAPAGTPFWTGLLVWAALLLGLFSSLLLHPDRFPAAAAPDPGGASGHGAILEAVLQSRVFASTGEVLYRTWSGEEGGLPGALSGNPPRAVPPLFTHPLYFVLQWILPAGLALTLVVLSHLALGGFSVYFLARRQGGGDSTALFSACAYLFTGGLLNAATRPAELGSLMAAALLPALLLAFLRLLEDPRLGRGALWGFLIAALAGAADPAALLLAFLLFTATAPALLWPDGRPAEKRRSLKKAALAILLGAVWGIACGAFRWTTALAAWAQTDSPAELLSPWWSGLESIRLPYHLGAVTLTVYLLSFWKLVTSPGKKPQLYLAILAGGLAAVGPRAGLPFLGFYFSMTASAVFTAAAQRGHFRRLAAAASLLATALLILEAWPAQQPKLAGKTFAEITPAPRWVNYLEASGRRGRVLVLGGGGTGADVHLDLLAFHQIQSWSGLKSWRSIDDIEETVPLAVTDTQLILSDLPDTRQRFPLLQYVRAEGKYLYLNPYRLGPIYWTQRVEILPSSSGEPAGAGWIFPRRPGAVALSGAIGNPLQPLLEKPDAGSAGEISPPAGAGAGRFGVIASAARTPNRLSCQLELPGPAIVVAADLLVPGIQARVDGKPAALFPANGRQVGLALGAGSHHLDLEYRPPGLEAGKTLTALALAALPFLTLLPVLRRLRRGIRRRQFLLRGTDFQPLRAPQSAAPALARERRPAGSAPGYRPRHEPRSVQGKPAKNPETWRPS